MHNIFKTLLATSAIVMTAGIANAVQIDDQGTVEIIGSVGSLPAGCTWTNPSPGAMTFDPLNDRFTGQTPASIDLSQRNVSYIYATPSYNLGSFPNAINARASLLESEGDLSVIQYAAGVASNGYEQTSGLPLDKGGFYASQTETGMGNDAMRFHLGGTSEGTGTVNVLPSNVPTKASFDPGQNTTHTMTYTITCFD